MSSLAVAGVLPPSTLDERVELGARDGIFFAHEWFPRTFRQTSPEFHYEMCSAIEGQEHPFVAFEVFRGGAKTTLLRTCTAKRVSYGLSRVAVFSSASQRHAERTIRWLKRQIEVNHYWTETFSLRQGSKWTDAEIEIINESLEMSIFVLAVGMTGQTRGINLDDYRPDFWVVDDPNDEENTATEEARKKTSERFFGAMQGSLEATSENPHVKMALAQTSLQRDDLINQCHRDPTWKTIKYGILDQYGKSRWESRYPTEWVLERKAGYIGRGQLHIWKREYECEIVAAEGKAFVTENVKFFDWDPVSMEVYLAIDPAREKHKNPTKAHKAALALVGVNSNGFFLLDYYAQKGKNPEELWVEFLRMALRYPTMLRMTGVESIAFQQMLAWYFREKMKATNYYLPIREIEDKRKKPDRIRQALTGPIQQGVFHVRRTQTEIVELLDQYNDDVDIDVLDAIAMAITMSSPVLLSLASSEKEQEEDYKEFLKRTEGDIPALASFSERCP